MPFAITPPPVEDCGAHIGEALSDAECCSRITFHDARSRAKTNAPQPTLEAAAELSRWLAGGGSGGSDAPVTHPHSACPMWLTNFVSAGGSMSVIGAVQPGSGLNSVSVLRWDGRSHRVARPGVLLEGQGATPRLPGVFGSARRLEYGSTNLVRNPCGESTGVWTMSGAGTALSTITDAGPHKCESRVRPFGAHWGNGTDVRWPLGQCTEHRPRISVRCPSVVPGIERCGDRD